MSKRSIQTTHGNSSFQQRLTAYSTVAVAGAACALATAPKAEAAIVYSGALNDTVTASGIGSYFNLTTFAFGASYTAVNGGNTAAPALNLWGTASSYAYLYPSSTTVNRFEANAAGATLELSGGTAIGPASTYGTTRTGPTGGIITNGGWTANTTGYFGIKFLDPTTGLTDYGWVYATMSGTPSTTPSVILGAAYDNTGAGILAGQTGAVPEPGTLGLLAAGALGAGALAWRRRQAA